MKKIITIIIIAILVLGMLLPTIAMAADIKESEKKLNDVNTGIKKVEEKIKDTKNEKQEVENELVELDKQLQQANKELQKTEATLATTNQTLDKTKKELAKAEEEMEEQGIALNERVRVMYKNGNVGYLEVLLDSSSFSELITRVETIKTIMEYDFELLTALEEKREEVETKKEEIEKEQQRIITLKNQLQSRAQQVQTLQVSRRSYVAKIDSDITTYTKQMNQLENDAAQATRIIQAAQRAAEQKAAAAKKAAAAAAASAGNSGGDTSNSSGNTNNSSGNVINSGGAYQWPVPGRTRISSPYGWRTHPIFKNKNFHTGIDIPAPTGQALVAPSNGVVTYVGYLGGYGNTVIVDLGGGISILGAHNSSLNVRVGQSVSKGQTIAKIGSTGNSTGPHSHFEVRKNGYHTNPLPYIR